jgi:hypothetical protein
MRTTTMTFATLAILAASALGSSIASESPNAPNSNASRPGAGAPNCAKLHETLDGCVFHTRKDQIDIVRLPMVPGMTWTATPSDAVLVEIREAPVETLPDGSRQQSMHVVPRTSADADVILKLEKRRVGESSAASVETRNINLMIHAISPAPAK